MWLPPCQSISAALGEMIDSPSTSAIRKPEKPGWKKVLLVSRQVDYTRRIYVFFFWSFQVFLCRFAQFYFFLLSVASFCWKIIRWTFFRHVPSPATKGIKFVLLLLLLLSGAVYEAIAFGVQIEMCLERHKWSSNGRRAWNMSPLLERQLHSTLGSNWDIYQFTSFFTSKKCSINSRNTGTLLGAQRDINPPAILTVCPIYSNYEWHT